MGLSLKIFLTLALIVSAPYTLLSSCSTLQQKREVVEEQLTEDRSNAEGALRSYLATKYGLAEEDYRLGYYVPLTLDTTLTLVDEYYLDPPDYYTGVWQALIIREDESFHVEIAVSGEELSRDSRQAEAYYLALEKWVRSELQLPEDCELDLYVDDEEYSTITQANLDIPSHIVRFFLGSEHYPALTGYYREGDLFSPITRELGIYIDYPEGYTPSNYVDEATLSQALSLEATGDISVTVIQNAPHTYGTGWYRSPTGETTAEP